VSFLRPVTILFVAASLAGISSLAAQKKNPYLLTRDEIAATPHLETAYDAVQQLRPRFLRASKTFDLGGSMRASSSPAGGTQDDPAGGSVQSAGILVVINGVRRGGVTELRAIRVQEIESIRFLKHDEASGIYGDQSGVIEVKTGSAP